MKALLYKEFKLAMHPICYVFIALFPFMILIPSYPLAIGFIYVLTCYPILFLGANKGQQSNDLLFSTLLPVRKKDIVLARIITVIAMQLAFMAIMSALCPLAIYLQSNIIDETTGLQLDVSVGLNLNAFVLTLAVAIIGFAVADLIFFPIYYKKGRSIVGSTLFTILGFVVYLSVFTIALPYIIGVDLVNSLALWIQFIALGVAILISAALHFVVYKVASKKLERVDF